MFTAYYWTFVSIIFCIKLLKILFLYLTFSPYYLISPKLCWFFFNLPVSICIYHLTGATGRHSPLLVQGILFGSLSDTTLFRADYWTDFKFNCVNFFCVDVSCSGVFMFFSTFLSWTFSVLLDSVNTTHGCTLQKVNLS